MCEFDGISPWGSLSFLHFNAGVCAMCGKQVLDTKLYKQSNVWCIYSILQPDRPEDPNRYVCATSYDENAVWVCYWYLDTFMLIGMDYYLIFQELCVCVSPSVHCCLHLALPFSLSKIHMLAASMKNTERLMHNCPNFRHNLLFIMCLSISDTLSLPTK